MRIRTRTTLLSALALAAGGSQSLGELPAGVELRLIEEDFTILQRRAWLETEWNKFEGESHTVEETLGALWSWRVAEKQDWAVRLKLPYKWHVAGEAAGDSDDQGLGDFKVATGTAFRWHERWRVGGGLDLQLPTAAEDLGDDVWRLQEILALAWDATPWLTWSPSAEYNQSVSEEPGAASLHYLEMFSPVTWLLPHNWAASAAYEAKVDFHDDNDWTHSTKVQVSRQLTRAPLNVSLSLKWTFDGGGKDFQVNFVLTWLFGVKPPARETDS